MTHITPPAMRGFQWTIRLQKQAANRAGLSLPEDLAPLGIVRAYAGEAPTDHA